MKMFEWSPRILNTSNKFEFWAKIKILWNSRYSPFGIAKQSLQHRRFS